MEALRSYMQREFLALLSLVHSHSPEAVMGLDRRCVRAVAFQVFSSACVPAHTAEPEGGTCSHHAWRSGPLWNPAWRGKEPGKDTVAQ